MREYVVHIDLRVQAKNMESADKKLAPVVKAAQRVGHTAHIKVKREQDASSDSM